jgi:DNA-3-methyladenine glycosylase
MLMAQKKTQRNSVMFENGGLAYVYLCYGMHNLFNVVTNKTNVAEAVLIRALEPMVGIDEMRLRRGSAIHDKQLTSGPGKLTKALGINRTFNGKSLLNGEIWIDDLGAKISSRDIVASPRIGIDYAGEDAALPWRYTLKGNRWVSK